MERVRSCQVGHGWMASRVVGEGEGVVVREAIALALDIAGKNKIAVQAEGSRQRWCVPFVLS